MSIELTPESPDVNTDSRSNLCILHSIRYFQRSCPVGYPNQLPMYESLGASGPESSGMIRLQIIDEIRMRDLYKNVDMFKGWWSREES
jgi:hypothetical protein